MLVIHPIKRYTYTDYKKPDVDDIFLYELINGELAQTSDPSPHHQILSGNLFRKMDGHIFGKKIGTVQSKVPERFVLHIDDIFTQ
jgi:hypothetical protein